ncbi:adhesion G-protein coupled receptor D1 [Nematostella vectensis]|uniref:adhesion G-protein coupled receptor D1 n=1 Tax=Nematostella vectensis TaxID=45351 RepID=UPI002076E4BC|nr:adhesion G-protein coupled receptor D1 [Nematostella vectensis]
MMMGSEHRIALSSISYIGLILSLLGEAITVAAYLSFLNVRKDRIQIRLNLIVNLMLAQIVLIAGLNVTGHKTLCLVVVALVQFTYTASFCWMLVEGCYLYRVIVKVFNYHIDMRYCYAISYGFPTLMVVAALLYAYLLTGEIQGYVSTNVCWMNYDNHVIWMFAGPVIFIATVNMLVLGCVVKEMILLPTVDPENSRTSENIRSSARAIVVLTPLLGITWLFGLLSLSGIGVVGDYIFTILNSSQGFMIFIFHCVRNSELKAAFNLRVYQLESSNLHVNLRSPTPSPAILTHMRCGNQGSSTDVDQGVTKVITRDSSCVTNTNLRDGHHVTKSLGEITADINQVMPEVS